jgi:thioredoxin 1
MSGHEGVLQSATMASESVNSRPKGGQFGPITGCGPSTPSWGPVTEFRHARGTTHLRRPTTARPARKAPMSSDLIKHTTDDSFSTDVLASDKPVLVDYWAEWCGPCKQIAPILDEVSKAYEGRLQIVKMNVDENTAIPAKFGIRGIPTLMLFKGGELAATKVGALPKAQLTAFIDGHL